MVQVLLTLLLLLCTSPAWAVTRYVDGTLAATCSGSTYSVANRLCNGSDGTGYKTVPAGLAALVAGDVLNIRSGTYVITALYGNVAADSYGTGTQATSWETATIIQNYPGEAVVVQHRGFNMDATTYTTGLSYLIWRGDTRANFVFEPSAGAGDQTVSFRVNNGVHHIRFSTMTIQNWRFVGIQGGTSAGIPSFVEIINNNISGNGDLDAGGNGNQEHGIYPARSADWLIERNDLIGNQAYGIHVYATTANSHTRMTIRYNRIEGRKVSGGSSPTAFGILICTGSGHKIHNNLIIGQGTQANRLTGGIYLCEGITSTEVYNNTIYDVVGQGIQIFPGVSGVVVKNNIFNTRLTTPIDDLSGVSTLANNHCQVADTGCSVTGAAGFVSAGTDFALASGSTAIDAGVNVGNAYNGSAPDIGAFETFTRTVSTVNGNLLDTTWGMALNTPILLATGNTGVTALVGGVGRTTTSTARLTLTDSVMRTTFNGAACVGGETWTETYVPGTITDSALIGGTYNQPGLAYTAASVTNSCGVAPPAEPGTPLIIYLLDDNTGSTADNTGSSAATDDGTLSGTFAWSAGKNTYGVTLTDLTAGSLAVPHGNALDPSATSLTVAFWVNVPTALTGAARTYFGHAGVASNRFYISTLGGTWRIGIQDSWDGDSSNLAVVAGWNRVCLSSGNPTATLSVNGTVGTGGASKSFTSYTFPSNLTLGSPFGASGNPGVVFDDFKLWATAEDCADDFANADPPSPPSSGTMAQVAHQFHHLRQTVGGTVESYGAQSATVRMRAGGAFMLTTQTDCTVAACGSAAERLRYNVNSGAFVEVPDTFGSDGVAFYGSPAASDVDILKGAVTCCLSGALTAIDGATQYTAAAVPVVTFTLGSSTTQRSVLRLDAAITATTVCFKRYTQQGEAYDAYTPAAGACVTVVPVSTGSGF